MAVTVTAHVDNKVVEGHRVTVTDVTFDNSYPTGGEPLTLAQLGLTNVIWVIATVKVAGAGSVTAVSYDVANKKLLAYAAGAQIANAVNLAAVTAQVVAYGV